MGAGVVHPRPITGGQQPHTIRCAWDYLAFTDEGAFAPGEGGWEPSKDTEPVFTFSMPAGEEVDPNTPFDHAPYANIRVLARLTGSDRFNQALPQEVRLWNQFNANKPGQVEVPFYHYEGETGPSTQNFYRETFPLKLDDQRCVAMFHITRGLGDTVSGFMDYKLWYCVSTDGGRTYDRSAP
jgi:hypothetical protein